MCGWHTRLDGLWEWLTTPVVSHPRNCWSPAAGPGARATPGWPRPAGPLSAGCRQDRVPAAAGTIHCGPYAVASTGANTSTSCRACLEESCDGVSQRAMVRCSNSTYHVDGTAPLNWLESRNSCKSRGNDAQLGGRLPAVQNHIHEHHVIPMLKTHSMR